MMFASALVSVFCFAPHVLLALGALLFWRYCRAAYRAPDIDAKGKWVLVTGAAEALLVSAVVLAVMPTGEDDVAMLESLFSSFLVCVFTTWPSGSNFSSVRVIVS